MFVPFCRECGEEIQDEWKSCPHCSNPIESPSQSIGVSDSVVMGDISTTHNDPEAISRGYKRALGEIKLEEQEAEYRHRAWKREREEKSIRIEKEEEKRIRIEKREKERKKIEGQRPRKMKLLDQWWDKVQSMDKTNIKRADYEELLKILDTARANRIPHNMGKDKVLVQIIDSRASEVRNIISTIGPIKKFRFRMVFGAVQLILWGFLPLAILIGLGVLIDEYGGFVGCVIWLIAVSFLVVMVVFYPRNEVVDDYHFHDKNYNYDADGELKKLPVPWEWEKDCDGDLYYRNVETSERLWTMEDVFAARAAEDEIDVPRE